MDPSLYLHKFQVDWSHALPLSEHPMRLFAYVRIVATQNLNEFLVRFIRVFTPANLFMEIDSKCNLNSMLKTFLLVLLMI